MQEEYVGLLIAIARRRIKQAVLRRVARHRLAVQQFWILVALSENPGISQSELAEQIHVDAPTASRVIAALTERELVRVELDPRDRRRSLPRLTSDGERLVRELGAVAQEVRSAVVRDMSEAELGALRRGLRKVISNMDRFEVPTSRRRTTS